jgi:uncharacterized iron-regulated protein
MGRLLGLIFCVLTAAAPARAATAADCRSGLWLDPASGTAQRHEAVLAAAAGRDVVLLGETHDDPEHHRWQLSVLAGLLGRRGDLAIGFEAFPARAQPVLDRWVAGELSERAFLDAVEWERIWGLDPALYLPLFHFARLHRLPMLALNVDRALVTRVAREGWAVIPTGERQGVGDPAPATPAYVDRLREASGRHATAADAAPGGDDPSLRRFVEAQLTWDRAMAEALARARAGSDAPLVVGVIGSEHLRHRHGVPHQLAALGVTGTAVLLPHELALGCDALVAGEADAVFVLDDPTRAEPSRPRLGVSLVTRGGEVLAAAVQPGSVAEAGGLRAGDVIVEAAGRTLAGQAELIEIVRGMTPGAWLPLVLRRDGRRLEAVAKFPPGPGGAR